MDKIRQLKTSDIFFVSKILKKMNLKIDTQKGKTQEQVGAEIMLSAFENLHMAENEVNEWFGSLIGKNGKEFADMPLETSLLVIKQLKEIPGITNFFKSAVQRTK